MLHLLGYMALVAAVAGVPLGVWAHLGERLRGSQR